MSELAYSEVRNPLALALETQVRLELEWAYVEKDLYSYSWSLIAQTPKKEDLKRLKSLIDDAVSKVKEHGTEKFTKTEFILGLCLACKALVQAGNGLKDGLVQTVREFLDIAKKHRWFDSEEFASVVLYCLGPTKEFRDDCRAVSKWLEERQKVFRDEGNYEKTIDCVFGLAEWKESSIPGNVIEDVQMHLSKLGVETLSKMCIVQKDGASATLVKELEKKLDSEFSSKPNYSLERAIRDLSSMLHSDYPEQAVSSFLEGRRKEGHRWAESIEYKDGQLLLKRTPELGDLPKIDPKAHSLELSALTAVGQTTLYTLNKASLDRAIQAARQATPAYVGIRQAEYRSILVIAAAVTLVLAIASVHVIVSFLTIRPDDVSSFILEVSRDWTRILTLGPQGILIFIWVWFVRILYQLRHGGQVDRMKLLRLIPLVGYVFTHIVSEEGDK